jgi:hypothetical protein
VVAAAPLGLTDVDTDAGVTGHGMVFTYTPATLNPTGDLIRNLEPLVVGEPLALAAVEEKLARRFRLLGTPGLVGIALAAVDMALWTGRDRTTRSRHHPGRESGPSCWIGYRPGAGRRYRVRRCLHKRCELAFMPTYPRMRSSGETCAGGRGVAVVPSLSGE